MAKNRDIAVPEPDSLCADCDGIGLVSCEICSGTGDDNGSECFDCWGSGLVSCSSCYNGQ